MPLRRRRRHAQVSRFRELALETGGSQLGDHARQVAERPIGVGFR
jgi:hypothetical protein